MKKAYLLALFLPAILAGCGGDGNDPFPFTGSYTGNYDSTLAENNDSGTLAVTVASDGSITGTATDTRFSQQGQIDPDSYIRRNGTVYLRINFPNGEFAGTSTFNGDLDRDGNLITGVLSEGLSADPPTFNFTLTQAQT